MGIIQRP